MFNKCWILIICILTVIGCENTDNLITPDQIDSIINTCEPEFDIGIENDKYVGTFNVDKVCANNVFIGRENQTPVAGSLVESTTIASIVRNTKNGNSGYEGKLVLITATVRSKGSDNDYLTLVTGDENLTFYIRPAGDFSERTFKQSYLEDESYEFVLYIVEQEQPNLTDDFTFNDNRYAVWSYLVRSGQEILDVSMTQLVSNTKQRNHFYEGKVVRFSAVVEFVLGDDLETTSGRDTISLVTGDDDVGFFVSPYGDILEGQTNRIHTEGQSYEFIVWIREQESDELTDDFDIWSFIIE